MTLHSSVTYSFFFSLPFLSEEPHHMTCETLVPSPGIKPSTLAVRVWSPNH